MKLSDEKEKPAEKVHGKDPYRYMIMFLYIVAAVIMGMAANPLTPIASTTQKAYSVTPDKITVTTTLCQLANIAISFPSVKVASIMGVRAAMVIGTFLIAAGFLLRVFINTNYYFVLAGQIVAGLGCPFINIITARVVTDWFNKAERGIWLALGSLGPVLGVLTGFVTPLFFVTDEKTTSVADQQGNIMRYMRFEFVLMIIWFGLVLLLWRPSPGTQEDDNKEVMINARETFVINDPTEATIGSLMTQIKTCISRPAVRSMFAINGLGFGLITAVGSLITPMLSCFDYPEIYGPLLACLVVVSGLVGSIAYSAYVLKFRYQYRNKYFFTGLAAVFFSCLCVAVINHASLGVIIFFAMAFGMPGITITVLIIEEIIRRVHGNLLLTATIINSMASQLVAASITYACGFYIEAGNEYNGSLIMMGFAGAFVLLFFYCFLAERNLVQDDQRKKSIKDQLVHDSEHSHSNSSEHETKGAYF